MQEILKYCSLLPYHNKSHAKDVWMNLSMLGLRLPRHMAAAYGHDILHTGRPREDDEAISARQTLICCRVYRLLEDSELPKVETMIEGTIFTDRSNLTGEQLFVADADIGAIGQTFNAYSTNAARLFVEVCMSQNKLHPTREEVLDFWRKSQEGFFKRLTDITGNADQPFLTDEAKRAFPHFASNRDRTRELLIKNPRYLIDLVKREWKEYWKTLLILGDEPSS